MSDESESRPLTRREAREAGDTGETELPAEAGVELTPSGSSPAIRDQFRAARDGFEQQVTQARGHFDQANERIKERTGRNLILAILIGVACGVGLLASLLFIKELFIPIAMAIALLATYELARALRAAGRRVDIVPQLIACAILVPIGYFAASWLSWIMLIAVVVFIAVWRMIAQMVAKDGRVYGRVVADVAISCLIPVYVAFLTSIALMLLAQPRGELWVLGFIIVATATDIFAYAFGLMLGKHPMAPRISPKKTWEGFSGGVIGAAAAGVLLGLYLLGIPWWGGLLLGIAVLASATIGDLAESMLKRDLGIKDMSSWLPGHGGVLDRLDSILPSTVPAFALYTLLTPWMVL